MGNEPIKFAPRAPFDVPAEDPRAICGHCGKPIGAVDIQMDDTPAGTVILTFRCKNCKVFQGHQVVPKFWVVPMQVIDADPGGGPLGAPDMSRVISDLRNPKKRS